MAAIVCFVCITRGSGVCIHASCWGVICVCSQSAMPTCRRIRDICDRNSSIHTRGYFCHTLLGCGPEHALWCCVQTRRNVYCGSYVTWAAPWWNMVLLCWTCQSHGQSSQFQEKGRKRVKTHTERGGGVPVRQVFPPVNHHPQNRSNDAGFLKRSAGWSWVKEDLMSHSLPEVASCQWS